MIAFEAKLPPERALPWPMQVTVETPYYDYLGVSPIVATR